MTRSSVEEYVDAIRDRYHRSSRKEKRDIPDEFTRVTGYQREAAIRLLHTRPKLDGKRRRGRRRQYDEEITAGLSVAWEATDRICSKRLKPFLPELVEILQDRKELVVAPQTAEKICHLSASTIDRLLGPFKHLGRRRPFRPPSQGASSSSYPISNLRRLR